jgi:hypothetical protein
VALNDTLECVQCDYERELGTIQEEGSAASFKILLQHSPGRTKENHETHKAVLLVSCAKSEPNTIRLQTKHAIATERRWCKANTGHHYCFFIFRTPESPPQDKLY